MELEIAKSCDFIMSSCKKFPFPINPTQESIRDNISGTMWIKAVDILKSDEFGYLNSIHNMPYNVSLNDEGKAFLAKGKTFQKIVENEIILKQNEKERQTEIDEQRRLNISLTRRQKKMFYPVFFIGLIGGICGIISLIMQIISKYF